MSAPPLLRLLAYYASSVGAITVVPFLSVVLSDEGLEDGEVALLLLLVPVVQLLSAPFWSWAADRGDARRVHRIASVLGAVAMVGLAAAPNALLLTATILLLALARPGVYPVGDALTMTHLGERGRLYGPIRAVGSIAFALLIFTDGQLRDEWPRAPLWLAAACMVGCALSSFALPSVHASPRRASRADVLALLRDPVLAPMVLVCVLHGSTIAAFDHFLVLHVEEAGLDPSVAGSAFAIGVSVEVVVLFAAKSLLARLGTLPLLVIGVAAGIPRWWITGHVDSTTALVATQALHGLVFGAYWAAGVALFAERAPRELSSTAQNLFGTGSFGVGYLVAMGVASVALQVTDTRGLITTLTGVSALATALLLYVVVRERRERLDR